MELFAADGHDAGGCERVTGKSGMRPAAVEIAREANTEATGELVPRSQNFDTALAQLDWAPLVTAGIAIAAVVVAAARRSFRLTGGLSETRLLPAGVGVNRLGVGSQLQGGEH